MFLFKCFIFYIINVYYFLNNLHNKVAFKCLLKVKIHTVTAYHVTENLICMASSVKTKGHLTNFNIVHFVLY